MNAKRLLSRSKTCFAILLLVSAAASAAFAGSIRTPIEQGNKLFATGDYTGAVDQYDQALLTEPQAVEPLFNKANCYFRLDDLEKAMDLYRETAAESKDMALVAKARYNLGNCYFRRGGKQTDSDLDKALEDMKTSITFWRQVLELEPDNKKAARNIEVARLTIKDIIDRINKQQEEQQQQAEKEKQLIEKLKELLAEQQTLTADTRNTNELRQKNQIDDAKTREQYTEQQTRQADLQQRTEETALELQQQDPNTPRPPKMDQAAQELAQAIGNQAAAREQLTVSDGRTAQQSEQKAAQYIENAINILSQEDEKKQQDQQQQQDPSQPEPDQSQDPNQPQDPNEQQDPQQDEKDQDKQEQEQEPPEASAQEILDKEQQQKKDRQMLQVPHNQRVDRDW